MDSETKTIDAVVNDLDQVINDIKQVIDKCRTSFHYLESGAENCLQCPNSDERYKIIEDEMIILEKEVKNLESNASTLANYLKILKSTIKEDQIIRSDFKEIATRLKKFNRERDWEQFHDTKNLALSLSIEASELNECFLWKNPEDASKDKIEEELADVFLCAIMLAEKYSFNIKDICLKKIDINSKKYPVERAKGNAKKYNEL